MKQNINEHKKSALEEGADGYNQLLINIMEGQK